MKKRILSLVLVVAFCLTLLPASFASAASVSTLRQYLSLEQIEKLLDSATPEQQDYLRVLRDAVDVDHIDWTVYKNGGQYELLTDEIMNDNLTVRPWMTAMLLSSLRAAGTLDLNVYNVDVTKYQDIIDELLGEGATIATVAELEASINDLLDQFEAINAKYSIDAMGRKELLDHYQDYIDEMTALAEQMLGSDPDSFQQKYAVLLALNVAAEYADKRADELQKDETYMAELRELAKAWIQQEPQRSEFIEWVKTEKRDELEAWLKEDAQQQELIAWAQQDEIRAELEAWLKTDPQKSELEAWLQEDAQQAVLEAWLKEEAQQNVLKAWLAEDAQKTQLEAWIQEEPQKAELEAWLKEADQQAILEAWMQEDAQQNALKAWLAEDTQKTQLEAWIQEEPQKSGLEEWLKEPDQQTILEAWMQESDQQTILEAWLQEPDQQAILEAWMQESAQQDTLNAYIQDLIDKGELNPLDQDAVRAATEEKTAAMIQDYVASRPDFVEAKITEMIADYVATLPAFVEEKVTAMVLAAPPEFVTDKITEMIADYVATLPAFVEEKITAMVMATPPAFVEAKITEMIEDYIATLPDFARTKLMEMLTNATPAFAEEKLTEMLTAFAETVAMDYQPVVDYITSLVEAKIVDELKVLYNDGTLETLARERLPYTEQGIDDFLWTSVENIAKASAVLGLSVTGEEFKENYQNLYNDYNLKVVALLCGEDAAKLALDESLRQAIKDFAISEVELLKDEATFLAYVPKLFSSDSDVVRDFFREQTELNSKKMVTQDFFKPVSDALIARGFGDAAGNFDIARLQGVVTYAQDQYDPNAQTEIIRYNMLLARLLDLRFDGQKDAASFLASGTDYMVSMDLSPYTSRLATLYTKEIQSELTIVTDSPYVTYERLRGRFIIDAANAPANVTVTIYRGNDPENLTIDRFIKSVTLPVKTAIVSITSLGELHAAVTTLQHEADVLRQLPTTVPVVLADGTTLDIALIWDLSNLDLTKENVATVTATLDLSKTNLALLPSVKVDISATVTVTEPIVPTISLDRGVLKSQYTLGDTLTIKGKTNLEFPTISVRETGAIEGGFYQVVTADEFRNGISIDLMAPAFEIGKTYTIVVGETGTTDTETFTVVEEVASSIVLSKSEIKSEYKLGEAVTIQGTTNIAFPVVSISEAGAVSSSFYQVITADEFRNGISIELTAPAFEAGKTYTITVGETGTTDTATFTIAADTAPYITLDQSALASEYTLGETVTIKGTTNLSFPVISVREVGATTGGYYQVVTADDFKTGISIKLTSDSFKIGKTYSIVVGETGTTDTATFKVVAPSEPYIILDEDALETAYLPTDQILIKADTNLPFPIVSITRPDGKSLYYATHTMQELQNGLTVEWSDLEEGTYTIYVGTTDVNDTATFEIQSGVVKFVTLDESVIQPLYQAGDELTVKGTTNLAILTVTLTDKDGKAIAYRTITKAEFESGITLKLPDDLADGAYTLLVGNNDVNDSIIINVGVAPAIALDAIADQYTNAPIAIKGTTNGDPVALKLAKGTTELKTESVPAASFIAGTTFTADNMTEGTYTMTATAGTASAEQSFKASDKIYTGTIRATVDGEAGTYANGTIVDNDHRTGTSWANLEIPTTVGIAFDGTDYTVASVTWDRASYSTSTTREQKIAGTYAHPVTGLETTIYASITLESSSSGGGGGGGGTVRYTITATAGEGGSIDPEGEVRVVRGGSREFKITADKGYEIKDVLVNGKSVGRVSTYTFENVTASGTIAASFQKTDMPDDYSEAYFQAMVDKRYFIGDPDGKYYPDRQITRAEFATVISRMLEIEPGEGTIYDDTETHWGRDFIAALSKHSNILRGYGDGNFGPDDLITREQAVAVICRARGYEIKADGGLKKFSDAEKISEWFEADIDTAIREGFLSGYEDDTMRPQNHLTRKEAAVLLAKAFGLVVEVDPTTVTGPGPVVSE